jgi:hypothetical protein
MSVMDGKVVVRDWVRLTDRLFVCCGRKHGYFGLCPALVFILLFKDRFVATRSLHALNYCSSGNRKLLIDNAH